MIKMRKLDTHIRMPFRIEDYRQELAQKGDFTGFRKTYTPKNPEVKDLNKKTFWNNRIIADRALLESVPIYQDKINIITRYLKDKKGKLLDVGFGWGILENKIKDYSDIDITGIDISNEAVKYANKKLRGKYKVANIFDIPFGKNNFDIVIALDILEHVKPSKVFSAYKEIKRVTKKGGIFIITIPINEGLEEMVLQGLNPVGHLRAYTPDIIKTELELSGFDILRTEFRTAFSRGYKLKNLIKRLDFLNLKHPNLMIIVSKKI